jgi:hypothetical protein
MKTRNILIILILAAAVVFLADRFVEFYFRTAFDASTPLVELEKK